MKNQMHAKLLIRFSLALALALALWSPIPARAAEPAAGEKMTEAKMMQHMQMGKESMAKCPMMKDKHDQAAGAHEKHHEEVK